MRAIKLSLPKIDSYAKSKTSFRKYLIDVSKACESTRPNESHWLIDTISVIRAIKVKEIYKQYFKTVISSNLPSSSLYSHKQNM